MPFIDESNRYILWIILVSGVMVSICSLVLFFYCVFLKCKIEIPNEFILVLNRIIIISGVIHIVFYFLKFEPTKISEVVAAHSESPGDSLNITIHIIFFFLGLLAPLLFISRQVTHSLLLSALASLLINIVLIIDLF